MKARCFIVAVCCHLTISFAQSPGSKPLSVGDPLPMLILSRVMNSSDSIISLANYRGKPLIIDFWSTTCTSCFSGFRKLDSLQQQLKGFNVIAVNASITKDNNVRVTKWLEKRKRANGENWNWPFVINDSVLFNLFPNRALPHYVWIDANGKVAAITGSGEVTYSNINKLISNQGMQLPVKTDAMDYEKNKPLLEYNNGGTEQDILAKSLLTRHLDGLSSGTRIITPIGSSSKRICFINQPILSLFAYAFPEATTNKVILDVKDTGKYFGPAIDSIGWWAANTFSYELTVPVSTAHSLMKARLVNDLNQTLSLNGRLAKKEVQCYVLTSIDANKIPLHSTKTKRRNTLLEEGRIKFLENCKIGELLFALNYIIPGQKLPSIVVDETGIDYQIDLSVETDDIQDLETLAPLLLPYGLKLTRATRLIDVFVLSEL